MQKLLPIFWLWIPLVGMVIQIILEMTMSPAALSTLHSENGFHETAQAVVLLLAFIISALGMIKSKEVFLKIWFGLAALCCLYVGGEEISWGQHIWNWTTPEYWQAVNDQQETNLHNTSSWFDQKPRLILLIGITLGGLVFPQLKKRGALKLPQNLLQLIPSAQLGVIALLAVLPHLIEKIFEAFDISIFARFSEVQELYMFYFVLLYLFILYKSTPNIEK